MKVVITGGGSGGHITPLLAVAAELRKQRPDIEIIYIGQRGDRLASVVSEHPAIQKTYHIWAGKFRRYHGEGWRQLLDIKTIFFNIRDMFLIVAGIVQSLWLIAKLRPKVVFVKGGFVGVPVGLAAAFWHVPYITHDSDAVAGLANRIIARWAKMHAVAMPIEYYAYPKQKTIQTGVPVQQEYAPVTADQQRLAKQKLQIDPSHKVVLVTGGGLGAKILNDTMKRIAEKLLRTYEKLTILHIAGHKHEVEMEKTYAQLGSDELRSRIVVKSYVTDLHVYSAAADVIIARAGATNIAEFAAQAKACILVPSPFLAGGHQLKNAQALADANAVEIVEQGGLEQNPKKMLIAVQSILDSSEKQRSLGEKLHVFANQSAAYDVAVLLLKEAKPEK